ncbi:hypothetical protein V8E53_012447 [Lactarius tabidus]
MCWRYLSFCVWLLTSKSPSFCIELSKVPYFACNVILSRKAWFIRSQCLSMPRHCTHDLGVGGYNSPKIWYLDIGWPMGAKR